MTQKLVVQSGPNTDRAMLGYVEREFLDVIADWEKAHHVEHFSFEWSSAPTLREVIQRVGRGGRIMLTHFVIHNTRQTLLGHSIAKTVSERSEWLSVFPDERDRLLADAAVLQSIANDAKTVYPPVAAEIESCLADQYLFYRRAL